VLFDKIASVYSIGKYVNILALETASPGNRHCANGIGALSFPRRGTNGETEMGNELFNCVGVKLIK